MAPEWQPRFSRSRQISAAVCLMWVLITDLHGQNIRSLPEGARADLFVWSEALKLWKKEPPKAEYELARGVLFECVAHSSVRSVSFGEDRPSIAGQYQCTGRAPENCHKEATKAFEAVVRLDSSLEEAKVRLAGLRIENEKASAADVLLLEAVARNGAYDPIRYIAAMLLGNAALSDGDRVRATTWFAEARSINPTALSARLASTFSIGAGGAARPVFVDAQSQSPGLDADPWYTHRCSPLEPRVVQALKAWIAALQRPVQ